MPTRILVTLILLLFLPGVYLTIADLTPAPHQEDFGAYYLAARALANGDSPFDKDAANRLAAASEVEQHSPYVYPPLLALVLRPLAALPYRVAAAIWFALSAAALLVALTLLRPVFNLPWRRYAWVCAAAFFLPPVHHTLQHGQITHFLLLMILAAALDRPGGSAWTGLAAALKIFPASLAIVYALSGQLAAACHDGRKRGGTDGCRARSPHPRQRQISWGVWVRSSRSSAGSHPTINLSTQSCRDGSRRNGSSSR